MAFRAKGARQEVVAMHRHDDETELQRPSSERSGKDAASIATPLLEELVGAPIAMRIDFFDGSSIGPRHASTVISVRSPLALRRILYFPGEIGLARAFVSGDIEVDGDLAACLRVLGDTVARKRPRFAKTVTAALIAAKRLGALGLPPPPPEEELRPRGRKHSQSRDSQVVRHHYDVGNDFYRLVLGETLVYSCARFVDDATGLDDAQIAKLDLSCRKLGLAERRGLRLLDVGCGWGSMVLHAAEHYGATAVGITLSPEQAELARERVKEAGLDDRVDIRVQDYRELKDERFDAIASIGMFEHVGSEKMAEYFRALFGLLESKGRFLNHAIAEAGGSHITSRSFIGRYVFPDGELIDVGASILAMQRAGFEVRDVENLREHYAKTLHGWVANLEENWSRAVALVGEPRARVWRLYMSASENRFLDGRIGVFQTLGVKKDAAGLSGMPPTRSNWG
jgi:cyclopropane-fatty-acyl-phospholipid synthase